VGRRAALTLGWAPHAPRLHALAYALWHVRALVRLARILGACAAGEGDPDATCAALLVQVAELDQEKAGSRRSDTHGVAHGA
jgi:hypothetical protein